MTQTTGCCGSKSPQGTVKTTFTYDTATNGVGKMATASNDGHTWRYSYDVMGRVTTQTLQAPIWNGPNQLTATAQYGFDYDGQLKDLYYPGFGYAAPGGSVAVSTHYQYSYDAVGRQVTLQNYADEWQTLAQNAQYNAAGQITSWQEPTTLTRTYDAARGWITNINAGGFINLTYSYLPDGRVASVTDSVNPGQSASYSYDELNRLTAATTPNWGLAFTYDDFGNRLTQSATAGSPPTKTLAYDNNNNRITDDGYQYDNNGNLTNMPGSTTLQYDVFDRLTRGPLVGEYYPWYGYDAFGKRVWRSSEGGIQHVYFYDPGGRLLVDLVVGGQATTYQYFAGQRIHQYTDRTGTVRFDRYVGARHYYPYGEEITSTNSDTYKFAQLHRDGDTGLDYAVNRYYGSGIGRFLNTDPNGAGACPSNPQTQNRFVYVHDDPVNYFDPLGTLEADPSGYASGPSGPCGPGWITDPSLVGPCSGVGGGGVGSAFGGGGGGYYPVGIKNTYYENVGYTDLPGNWRMCIYVPKCTNGVTPSCGKYGLFLLQGKHFCKRFIEVQHIAVPLLDGGYQCFGIFTYEASGPGPCS